MEYFTRMQHKVGNQLCNSIKLTNKKTGEVLYFPLYFQQQLKHLKSSDIINQCEMGKLEVEYDYETDFEQQTHAKKMLKSELTQAIDFFVEDDPIKLVENATYQY